MPQQPRQGPGLALAGNKTVMGKVVVAFGVGLEVWLEEQTLPLVVVDY
jgi:hypothetical protein